MSKTEEQQDRDEILALVQTTPIGDLPPAIRVKLEERRILNRIASAIAGLSWGKNMDRAARIALTEWGRRNNVDVTQEVYILGDRLYLNAQFYKNRIQPLIHAGLVEYLVTEHAHVDGRLDPKDEIDAKEIRRRRDVRIQYNLPDKALAAVVARLKLRSSDIEFSAGKWCGNKGTGKNGNLKDPIGEESPAESAETRAIRRVGMLVVSHIPALQQSIDLADDDASLNVRHVISEGKARVAEEERIIQRQLSPARVIDATESYGADPIPVPVASTELATDKDLEEDRRGRDPDYIDDSDLVD